MIFTVKNSDAQDPVGGSLPKSPLSEVGPFIEQSMPRRVDFPTEIEFCRAMQRWALDEVPSDNPQRLICINDWFAEEFLLTSGEGAT